MADLISVFQRLDALGLTDVLLPFLLIFSVMYAIMGMINLFGEGNKGKNVRMIVALTMGLLVVVPHVTGGYPPGGDVVDIINTAIPNVSVVVIAVVMVLILIGIFGVRVDLMKDGIGGIIPILAILVVGYIFGRAAGWFDFGLPSWLGFLDDPDTVSVLLVILVFIIIIGFITGDGNEGKRLGTSIRDTIGEFGKLLTR